MPLVPRIRKQQAPEARQPAMLSGSQTRLTTHVPAGYLVLVKTAQLPRQAQAGAFEKPWLHSP